MRILYILNNLLDFKSGCHFYRIFLPSLLMIKNGVDINYVTHNYEDDKLEEMIKSSDIISFSRAYRHKESLDKCIELCKKHNKKIVYDLDDDIWNIIDENPAKAGQKILEECGDRLLKDADVITTTTEDLANILRKKNKSVVVIPNAIDPELFRDYGKTNESLPIVVYSGSASHWNDMLTILPTLEEVKKEHPFAFVLIGFTGAPLDSAMYEYNKLAKWGATGEAGKYQTSALKCYEYLKRMRVIHYPFYTPELYPDIFSKINADIGLCPLEENEFNHSKSCVKFYEYGACGVATIAPRLLPYSNEVEYSYTDVDDFKRKLTKLLVNREFRKGVAKKQHDWVLENRDINKVVKQWMNVYEGTNSKDI